MLLPLSQLTSILESYSSHYMGSYPQKYKCFNLSLSNNHTLFQFLEEAGYWIFAPNRSKKLVYYHQIVNFFHKGYKFPPGSGDTLECHHCDSNVNNNHPTNLVYLSPHDHSLVTKLTRRFTKLKLKHFYNLQKYTPLSDRTQLNNLGKLIRNWTKFIIHILIMTLYKSFSPLLIPKHHFPIKPLVSYISKYVGGLQWTTTYIQAMVLNQQSVV